MNITRRTGLALSVLTLVAGLGLGAAAAQQAHIIERAEVRPPAPPSNHF